MRSPDSMGGVQANQAIWKGFLSQVGPITCFFAKRDAASAAFAAALKPQLCV